MAKIGQTPSQTVGPYFAYGLTPEQYGYPFKPIADGGIATADTEGEHIRIEGRVLDGNGEPIQDAMIEIWQADAKGRYNHPADPRRPSAAFVGFGRFGTGTDPQHRFLFETVKPGSVDGIQAPHLNAIVLMRGMLLHACTRFYFSDEEAANAVDPTLATAPAERRHTLIARRVKTEDGVVYKRDIYMQGPQETVFFDA